MSDTLKIGQLITDEQQRDAVHMAIVPVVASQKLLPGEHVSFSEGKAYASRIGLQEAIGIVDPFLKRGPGIGDRFWLFLYPGSITSLRHDWTHPSFQDEGPKSEKLKAKIQIESFAKSLGVDYDELMEHASDYVRDDDNCWCEGGRFESVSVPKDFWKNYEAVTGVALPEGHYGHFFSCLC